MCMYRALGVVGGVWFCIFHFFSSQYSVVLCARDCKKSVANHGAYVPVQFRQFSQYDDDVLHNLASSLLVACNNMVLYHNICHHVLATSLYNRLCTLLHLLPSTLSPCLSLFLPSLPPSLLHLHAHVYTEF